MVGRVLAHYERGCRRCGAGGLADSDPPAEAPGRVQTFGGGVEVNGFDPAEGSLELGVLEDSGLDRLGEIARELPERGLEAGFGTLRQTDLEIERRVGLDPVADHESAKPSQLKRRRNLREAVERSEKQEIAGSFLLRLRHTKHDSRGSAPRPDVVEPAAAQSRVLHMGKRVEGAADARDAISPAVVIEYVDLEGILEGFEHELLVVLVVQRVLVWIDHTTRRHMTNRNG